MFFRTRQAVVGSFAALALVVVVVTGTVYAGSTGTISKEELRQSLDDPDLVILDVRAGRDWNSAEFKIKGAIRVDPRDVESWAMQYSKEKRYVAYCA